MGLPYVSASSGGFLDDFRTSMKATVSGGRAPANDDSERRWLIRPAPNAIQWCIRSEYCNSPALIAQYDDAGNELPGYWRSYQVIRDTFQLRCPICNRGGVGEGQPGDCWGRSRAYLESEVLLEWSETHRDDVCPKCTLTRAEFEQDNMLKRINVMHLVCGQRAGKSVTVGLIGTYVEHRILTLALGHPDGLRAYFGLTLKDPFEMTFLASNDTQSRDTIWAKYRAFRRDSPWFQRFVPWVKRQEEQQITPAGMERWSYSESNSKIINEHPDIYLIANSLNSNSAGLRGRTRVFGGVDEISHMMDSDSRVGADEIYRAVDNSLQTIRSRALRVGGLSWLGLMASATSPRDHNDKGMRLLRDADKAEGMLAFHYPTWDFNPYEPRANFDDMFAKDPVGAERDFGANPPRAAHPLIMDRPRFRAMAVRPDLQPTAEFRYRSLTEGNQDYVGIQLSDARLSLEYPRYIAFDAGKNFDAFAGACAHGEIYIDPETGVQRIVTVYDWVLRILPPPSTEVYFDDIFSLIRGLTQKQHIAGIEFDHWNATQLIQQIRKFVLHTAEVGVKGDDYRRFRADVYNGLVMMLPPDPSDYNPESLDWTKDPPWMQPTSCALYELEGLEEDPETLKVWNPRKGERRGYNSNDVAEVIVHAHKMVQEAGYTKKPDERSAEAARKRSEGDSRMYVAGGGGTLWSPERTGIAGGGRNWSPNRRGW